MRWLALWMVTLFVTPAVSGEYNPLLNIGDAAPVWKSLPGVDGKLHSLSDLEGSKAVVVAFTCNSCPYAVDYEDRLNELERKFGDRDVAIVAINVNRVEDDKLPAMKERAAQKGFEFTYVYDETQQIARDFGATYTPEFFVLDAQRRIAYMGAMDNSPDGSDIQNRYVDDAIQAVLAGQRPATTETVAIGCRVRFERAKRTRKKK